MTARGRTLLATAATLALFAVLAVPAQAAVTVTNTNDSGPGSLRQAIETAPAGETIELPAGTYGVDEELVVERDLTILGHSSADTIVRAAQPTGIFYVINSNAVTIANVTIRDGAVKSGSVGGVGVLSINTNLTLANVVIANNVADTSGAPSNAGGSSEGAGLLIVEGSLTMSDSRVVGNTAIARGGSGRDGGSAIGGGALIVAPATITNSTFSGNVTDAQGGQGPSNPEQEGGTATGAGLYIVSLTGATRLSRVSVNGNVADASGGAGADGGRVQGGGFFAVASSSATETFENLTLAQNAARAIGPGSEIEGAGAFVFGGPGAQVTMRSDTIVANRSEAEEVLGGNIFASGKVAFENTIVSGGEGGVASPNCHIADETVTSLGFNLDSTDQCDFHAQSDKVNTDPLLGPLQDNGGVGPTMVPIPSSPAVDQGSGFGLTTDARSVIRPIDFPTIPNGAGSDGTDIGAVELQPSSDFKVGKAKRNKKKGTARVTVTLPQPAVGSLRLAGKAVRGRTVTIDGQKTKLVFTIKAKGKALKKLRRKGKRTVGFSFTYSPTGNAAATNIFRVKLLKKKHRGKKRGRK